MPGALDLVSPWGRGPTYYILRPPQPRRVGWLHQPAPPEASSVRQEGTCWTVPEPPRSLRQRGTVFFKRGELREKPGPAESALLC